MVLENHMKLYLTKPDFLKKKKEWAKNRFFKSIEKKILNLVYDESYYLLYPYTSPIFGKNLVPQIWAKMALLQSDYRIFKSTIILPLE